ncbi:MULTISPECIES: tyrosine-protein phosphatase [Bacillaceae]|uniref:tyrosine-protein phosphatase n=1 Tax=Bacillaceae TaxID=186817 RepID=UPI000BFDB396|nr:MULTISPECIES: CpsB/CapC family capsule biosynthesis tyrosine phosphatase [Bacillaceae]PGT82978.1 tyrosine protein phosphatase [Bacillus sp. AFS040349]UGB29472.1 tyrosine protein phosphatase [Metabacillus sp. B2-18]
MIDIHCHILADADDGANNIEESIKMAKVAVNEGITKIIATPHHKNGRYENDREKILNKIDQLQGELQKEKINIEILPGQEIRIYGEIVEDLEKGELLTIGDNSSYMLIELPHYHVPRYTYRLLYDLQVNGIIPVIVHPERNHEILEKPDLLYKLIKDGALSQITAASITGMFGKRVKKLSFELIDHNLTHFIASDAHNTTMRSFHLRDAYDAIEKQIGVETKFILQENANLVCNNRMVYKEMPEKVKNNKIISFFTNRM